jgi:hypothetical protein
MKRFGISAALLLVCASAGELAAQTAPPTITSSAHPGTIVVSGTAQKVDAAHANVVLYFCVVQTPPPGGPLDCQASAVPVTYGSSQDGTGLTTKLDGTNGTFQAFLGWPLLQGQSIYVEQMAGASNLFSDILAVLPLPVDNTPPCVTSALSGYRVASGSSGTCIVHLDRNDLATPPAITVPKGTHVIVQLDNARWDEMIQFNRTTTQNSPEDVAANIFKALQQNLSGLVLSQQSSAAHKAAEKAAPPPDSIMNAEDEAIDELQAASIKINNANTRLTCFEQNKGVVPASDNQAAQCSSVLLAGPLDPANTFRKYKNELVTILQAAAKSALPSNTVASLPDQIKGRQADCAAKPPTIDPSLCTPVRLNDLQTMLDNIKSVVASLEKTQQALLSAATAIQSWPGLRDDHGNVITSIRFTVVQNSTRTSTITVAATEIVTLTSTNLVTVNVTWVTQPFVLSSGILLSTLPNRSYAISQLVINGAPVPDPTNPGKYLTYINQTVSHPSVSLPMVLGSWRVRQLSDFSWQNKCPNHCAILVSGGMGFNIIEKSADFAAGLSFQLGSVMFTPAAHFSRESLLIDGLYPNEILGSNPPSALQTQNAWTVHAGLAFTIVIP